MSEYERAYIKALLNGYDEQRIASTSDGMVQLELRSGQGESTVIRQIVWEESPSHWTGEIVKSILDVKEQEINFLPPDYESGDNDDAVVWLLAAIYGSLPEYMDQFEHHETMMPRDYFCGRNRKAFHQILKLKQIRTREEVTQRVRAWMGL